MKSISLFLVLLALAAGSCSPAGVRAPTPTLAKKAGKKSSPAPAAVLPARSVFRPFDAGGTASDPWVDATLAKMTLEQKAGQMLQIGIDGREASTQVCQVLKDLSPGGIVLQAGNAYNPSQARRLSNGLQGCAETAVGVPLFISVDHEGEYLNRFNEDTTTFPTALALGATGDPETAYQVALAAGQELAYAGVNMVLGPVADVLRNYDNEVVSQRTFGGDPQQVSRFVAKAVQGYQGAGLVTVLKHFPGHGGVAADSHKTLPVDHAGRQDLEETYLPPFRAGLEAGAPVVMLGHVSFPQVSGFGGPASLSPEIVHLLREELGFQGVILSDSLDMQGATGGVIPVEQASLEAVQAGVDQVMITSPEFARPAYDRLLAAIRSGQVPASQVDASVRRILAVKAAWNLTSFPRPKAAEPDWQADDFLSYEVGRRSVTLLKNEAGLVPLPASARRVLVIAPRAEWELYTKLEKALKDGGREVEFAYYPPPWEGPVKAPDLLESLPSRAAAFDLVLAFTWQAHLNRLVLGDAWQADLIQALSATGRPLVVVAVKSPTDLLSLPPLSTYLAMFGSTDGQTQALIDALTGASAPVGQNPLPDLLK